MRSLLLTVFALLALAAPTAALAQEASPAASPASAYSFETTVTTDGRGLHIACAGAGSPTVLFDIGGPNPDGGVATMAPVAADVAAALGTRLCAYDRAGVGQSDPDPAGVRDLQADAADLNAVLASPELECPCVVIGESLGGAIALTALAEDPSGFAGLVLLDAPYPGFLDEFLALAPAGSPEAGFETESYFAGENEEGFDHVTGFRQIAAPETPPGIPIVVIAHGAGDPPPCFPCSPEFPAAEYEAAWQAGQAALATTLGARLVVAEGTSHFIAEENPGLIIGTAAEVVAAVRDPSTWGPPAASPAA